MNGNMRSAYDPNRIKEVSEAADILRVSSKQINIWIEEGHLDAYQMPAVSTRMVLVNAQFTRELIERQHFGIPHVRRHRVFGLLKHWRRNRSSPTVPGPQRLQRDA